MCLLVSYVSGGSCNLLFYFVPIALRSVPLTLLVGLYEGHPACARQCCYADGVDLT